jgi:hypothetical protein
VARCQFHLIFKWIWMSSCGSCSYRGSMGKCSLRKTLHTQFKQYSNSQSSGIILWGSEYSLWFKVILFPVISQTKFEHFKVTVNDHFCLTWDSCKWFICPQETPCSWVKPDQIFIAYRVVAALICFFPSFISRALLLQTSYFLSS